MRFIAHYSTSSGNLYEVISASGNRLLIDPGVTWTKLQKAIKYDLSNIEGLICSHSHADHSKAAENILDAGIDLFSSRETLKQLGLAAHRNSHIVEDRRRFSVGDTFYCLPFLLEHDADGTLGFVIQDKQTDEYLLYINDTFMVKQRFGVSFSIICISCNYDGDWLQKRVEEGLINETYAKRLLTSHMEKNVTKSYIRDCCCLDKCTEIHLLHMSGTNIDKEKIRAEVEKEFFIKTCIAGN